MVEWINSVKVNKDTQTTAMTTANGTADYSIPRDQAIQMINVVIHGYGHAS